MNMEELKKISYEDYQTNLVVLADLKECIENNFLNDTFSSDNFIKNLYSNNTNEEWFFAQYKSILNQIDKLINAKSTFHKYYDHLLADSELLQISQELIFDISHLFTNYVKKECSNIGTISRSNYISSQDFFLNVKFAYFSKKYYPNITGRNFNISAMPTIIRQAIEIKIKEIIGIIHITKKDGSFQFIPISKLIDFIIEDEKYFNLPIDVKILKYINIWTNTFTHSGITPFFWQSLEAIDAIEKLFSIKENQSINLEGFKFRIENIEILELKEDLDKKFNAIFYLENN
jgi:hypothetical protein